MKDYLACTREGSTPVVSAEYNMYPTRRVRLIWRAFCILLLPGRGDDYPAMTFVERMVTVIG